ncbi:hypothetical protein BDY24DRAFT_384729 [Mrakia frigida]|uniref:uncharacterized protein n=1 Tax=Mrakia frigida TaxID=29902 RepID=UPI003FCC0ACE
MAHCKAPTTTSFGHLIFHQSSQDLLARRDDIRPGDVITLSSASFKGKKGLQSYAMEVGQGVAIVLEFEVKKSKIRVVQAAGKANHYPTLESVSYRLEDLKAGDVRVFRPVHA